MPSSDHGPEADDLERVLGDLFADGSIDDDTADEVRTFADFLRHAGPPVRRDDAGNLIPPPDGKTVVERLRDAGRLDLLDWALNLAQPTTEDKTHAT